MQVRGVHQSLDCVEMRGCILGLVAGVGASEGCILEFGLGGVDVRSDRGEGRAGR